MGESGSEGHEETGGKGTDDTKNRDSWEEEREQSGFKGGREVGVLAQYSIPLGGNEATLTFKGDSLSIADFDALIEYVELFKKQFERKKSAAEKQQKDLLNSFFGGANAPAAPKIEKKEQ